MNESIRDVLRRNLLRESEPPGDLRKLFPKRSFKGWKAINNKKNRIGYEKGQFVFSVDASYDAYPRVVLEWPVSVGEDFLPSGSGWMPYRHTDPYKKVERYTLSVSTDEETIDRDLALLKKIMALFIAKAK